MSQVIRRSSWRAVPAVILPAALTVALFVSTLFLIVIPSLHSRLMNRKREMIQELARTGWGVVAKYEEAERMGRLTRPEAQARAIDHLRDIRYGADGRGYFWIVSVDGRGLLHPYTPGLEGQDLSALVDSRGTRLYDRILRSVAGNGGGFFEYDWQWHDDPDRIVPKVSYVKAFEPWGWIVGTGMYIQDVQAEIAENTQRLIWISVGILAVVSGLTWVIIRTDLRLERRRRRAESQLRKLNAELEQRVWQRTAELRHKNKVLDDTITELREREHTMSEELQLAHEVQQEFLPKVFPFSQELHFAALCRSSLAVGGDLYDAFRVDDNTAGFYIADVSGHGVSAALLTATLKVSFDRFRETIFEEAGSDRTPASGRPLTFGSPQSMARFMHALNNALVESIPLYSFVTFQLGIVELGTGRLRLANAGHNPPLCYRKTAGRVEPLPVPSNLPLGTAAGWRFQIQEYQLQPGDRLLVHTDGITECQNARREEFGQHNLIRIIERHHAEGPHVLLRRILEHTQEFSGQAAPSDDQAVLVIDFHAYRESATPATVTV